MGQEALFKGKIFGGFDRKNVMDYIEYLQNKLIEAEKNAGNSNLESDEEAFKKENEKLSDFIEELEEKNSLLKDENDALRIKCRQLEESLSELESVKSVERESDTGSSDSEEPDKADFEETKLAENDLFSSDEDDYSHIEFTVEKISEEVSDEDELYEYGEPEHTSQKNDIEFVDDVQDSVTTFDDEKNDEESLWDNDESSYSAEVARLIEKYTNNRQRGRNNV